VRAMPICPLAVIVAFLLAACSSAPATRQTASRPRLELSPKPELRPIEKSKVLKRGRVTTIDLSALYALQQNGRVLLYDARPSFVYAFGHLPAAINWPRGLFAVGLPLHEPEVKAAIAAKKKVVLYCTDAGCPDSGVVAQRLAALGYSVSVLDGGFATWKEAGLTIE
jgi:rhodanese-related sulfurtransferase